LAADPTSVRHVGIEFFTTAAGAVTLEVSQFYWP
jgi:hypothetical protein